MGSLPNGWKLKTIGDMVRFEGGSQPPKSTFAYQPLDGHVRLIQIRDYRTDAYVTYVPKHLAKKFCQKDDIMIGRYGPPLFQVFRGLEGAYNVALIKAVPRSGVDRNFLYYYLTQGNIVAYLESLSQRTGGQTGIEMDRLNSYPFPLPPLPEQRKIAAILGAWDAASGRVEQLIAALQRRKQGLMQRLLTGAVRFPEFLRSGEYRHERYFGSLPTDWRVDKLGLHLKPRSSWITLDDDKLYRRCTVKLHNRGVVPRDAIPGSELATKRQQLTREGDLIVAEIDAKVGGFGIVKADTSGAIVSSHYYLFEIGSEMLPDYLEQQIFYGALQRQVTAVGSTNYAAVRATDVLAYRLPIPSLSEQIRIADCLKLADREIALQHQRLAQLQAQKKGLMQRLLTGQVRVKGTGSNGNDEVFKHFSSNESV